jgi:hypothetical protein
MATITVRAIDPVTFEPQQGNGQNNFISDLAAIVQIINTRLRLFQGEWFLNLLDGLPLFQSIEGSSGDARNIQLIINLISNRISQTIGVTSISQVTSSYQNRHFKYSAVVQTQFGVIVVNNSPGTTATLSAST